MQAPAAPSPFLLEHLDALARAARLGPVVDVACGEGRHAQALAERGIPVVGVDLRATALAALRARARERDLAIHAVRADLEAAPCLPLAPGRCGALLVFRYLHRPLAPQLAECLRPGGLLLYETFTVAQSELGYGPRNPAFLLEPGELARLFPRLETSSYWEGITQDERPAALARLLARRQAD
jgi:SAM-dependent methyltransferase